MIPSTNLVHVHFMLLYTLFFFFEEKPGSIQDYFIASLEAQPNLLKTFLVLAWKLLCPRKSLSSGQTRMVDYPTVYSSYGRWSSLSSENL